MPQRTSPLRHAVNAVVGLILLAVFGGLCFQIYRVVVGEVPVYGRDETVAEQVKEQVAGTPTEKPTATTPEVSEILGTQAVSPPSLGGTEDQVVFRAPGGQIACVIATDLATVDPAGWVPLPSDPQGAVASGPGAVCIGIANLAVHPGDARACPAGESLRSSVVGVWDASRGIGVCSPDTTRFYADVKNHTEGGDRFTLPELKYATHVRVGDYACTVTGAEATCVNVTTGNGFTLQDNVGYTFLPRG